MAKEYKGRLTGAEIDALPEQLREKQDLITVTAKDNGNIILHGIGTGDIEFMPATPSGDPLHYAYIAAGATWNALTGYWEYRAADGGLTDLTSKDMCICFCEAWLSSAQSQGIFCAINGRTTITNMRWVEASKLDNSFRGSNLEVAVIGEASGSAMPQSLFGTFCYCPKLRKIIGVIDLQYASTATIEFRNSPLLEEVRLMRMKMNVDLSYSKLISKDSIRYMIRNAAPTTAITIKLALEPYLIFSGDKDVVNDLARQPLITLIS